MVEIDDCLLAYALAKFKFITLCRQQVGIGMLPVVNLGVNQQYDSRAYGMGINREINRE